MNTLFRPNVDTSKFVVQELRDELLLYNLETNKIFALNQTSAFVWQNSDGKKTVAEIAIAMELDLEKPVPDELVWLTLERLQNDELIRFDEKTLNEFKVNRR